MTPHPRGYPAESPMESACNHAQARAKRAPQDVPVADAHLVNHRYLAALALHRAPRIIAPSATVATFKLWHEEKRVKFDVIEAGQKRTVRTKIQLAFARVRYGSKRRAWFTLRTSSHGATVNDSRAGGSRRSFAFIHADLTRMQLDADAICAHLRSVLVERAPSVPRETPAQDQREIGAFHRAPAKRAPRVKSPRHVTAPRDFRSMNGGALAAHNRGESRKAREAFHVARIAPLLPVRQMRGTVLTQAEFEARRIRGDSPRVK